METKTFNLSGYAYVEASVDYAKNERTMCFAKQNYSKGLTKAPLSELEWLELRRKSKEIEKVAEKMHAKIDRHEEATMAEVKNMTTSDNMTMKPWQPWELTYFLSDQFLAKLSMYRAPDESTHVTLNIRSFYRNDKGAIYYTRQQGLQGVSLTYPEISTLRQVMAEVDDFVSQKYEDEDDYDDDVDGKDGPSPKKRKTSEEEEEESTIFKLTKKDDLIAVTSFIEEFVHGQPDKLTCSIRLDKTQLEALSNMDENQSNAVADSAEIDGSQVID